jgi:hypothetical protein
MISFALIRERNPDIGHLDDIAFLQSIDLSNCRISSISNLDLFTHIKQLDLSHNSITLVEDLELFTKLEYLDLSYNKIDGQGLIDSIKGLPKTLQQLNLTANPCATDEDALLSFQDKFPELGIIIDVETVDEEEAKMTANANDEENKEDEHPESESITTKLEGPLNADDVLKEIVDRKCRLQNMNNPFDLDKTLLVNNLLHFNSIQV